MSTILKALRRLEDDDPKKKRTGAPPVLRDGLTPAPLPATDPRAADALRGRILAEEAAARVGAEPRDDESPNPRRLRPFILRTLVASLLVAAVAFAVTESGLFSTAPTVDSASCASTSIMASRLPNHAGRSPLTALAARVTTTDAVRTSASSRTSLTRGNPVGNSPGSKRCSPRMRSSRKRASSRRG